MKELSKAFTQIFNEGKEEKYHDELVSMLKSLDESQRIIREAFHLFLSRNIKDN